MEFIVSDCSLCGGWCCRCLSAGGTSMFSWYEIDPVDVLKINPWIPEDVDINRHQWVQCKLLSNDGLCTSYEDRSSYCRSYPNIDILLEEYLSDMAWFYTPWCFYRAVVLEFKGIPYKVLTTGAECLEAYLKLNSSQSQN